MKTYGRIIKPGIAGMCSFFLQIYDFFFYLYYFSNYVFFNVMDGSRSGVLNIRKFIESLPLKYNTKIGMEGNGLSQGQRQRILIARAVYKNPSFLFLDEATNALDANNEKIIIDNLNEFYRGRTVVIVAHRLSTVQNADNIIVLEKGKVLEMGRHEELVRNKGAYYSLVKNQLELGV
jgi:ATP-binding cassette subfamily B protein